MLPLLLLMMRNGGVSSYSKQRLFLSIAIPVIFSVACLAIWYWDRDLTRKRQEVNNEILERLDDITYQLRTLPPPTTMPQPPALRDLYLNTVRDAITGIAFRTTERSFIPTPNNDNFYKAPLGQLNRLSVPTRSVGGDWPVFGLTMIGNARMDNIRTLLERVDREHISGDFMECGVWRGGGSIFARAVISTSSVKRDVWLADSFEGLPKPRKSALSKDDAFWSGMSYLRVSLEDVRTNIEAFGLLDSSVHFCKGFFVDSLPTCRPERIAVLRMDGDMYESTLDQLYNLFPRVSVGGFIIVDDWTIEYCKRAITDFWNWHGLVVTPVKIDDSSMYWQKTSDPPLKLEKYQQLKS